MILALADDLTGALEVGAKFADYGLETIVASHPISTSNPSVLVINTQTRHLPASEAHESILKWATAACSRQLSLLYKKTDSTLRGNIGPELRALAVLFPHCQLIYAPAYPDLGRTVKSGELLVWGTPVHMTEFAGDPFHPIQDSRVSNMVGPPIAKILDGETNADLEAAASNIMAGPAPRVCAGPAALAGVLAALFGSGHKRQWVPPKLPRCLIVNGSLHPASLQQIKFAQDSGLFGDGWVYLSGTVTGSGSERARQTGQQVRSILASSPFDALIVFGGDTAFGIHQALGAVPFEPLGELAPGIPVSRSDGIAWVTKAGGFGRPDVLRTIKEHLS